MDQLVEKTSVVEQLKKTISELQLEVDNLHAQNLLLTMRTGDEFCSTLHASESARVNEASSHSR